MITTLLRQQKGAVAMITALALVSLIGFAALAVDVGYMHVTRNELQNIADGAALAAANELALIYRGNVPVEGNLGRIDEIAKEVAGKNNAATVQGIEVRSEDIVTGYWNSEDHTFTPDAIAPNSVWVTARCDGLKNNPVETWLGKALSDDSKKFSSNADAIASLTGPMSVNSGQTNLPIGISTDKFDQRCPEDFIELGSSDSCAGWHVFYQGHVDATRLQDLMFDLIANHPAGINWLNTYYTIAPGKMPDGYDYDGHEVVSVGDEFNYIGGDLSCVFNGGRVDWKDTEGRDEPRIDPDTGLPKIINGSASKPAPFYALFDFYRMNDEDGDNSTWTTVVPVYDYENKGCENPKEPLEIIGFATIKIAEPAGSTYMEVEIPCEMSVVLGRGGGNAFGNLVGHLPNLVQ